MTGLVVDCIMSYLLLRTHIRELGIDRTVDFLKIVKLCCEEGKYRANTWFVVFRSEYQYVIRFTFRGPDRPYKDFISLSPSYTYQVVHLVTTGIACGSKIGLDEISLGMA